MLTSRFNDMVSKDMFGLLCKLCEVKIIAVPLHSNIFVITSQSNNAFQNLVFYKTTEEQCIEISGKLKEIIAYNFLPVFKSL
jgi:hypothetical protein